MIWYIFLLAQTQWVKVLPFWVLQFWHYKIEVAQELSPAERRSYHRLICLQDTIKTVSAKTQNTGEKDRNIVGIRIEAQGIYNLDKSSHISNNTLGNKLKLLLKNV